jgi:hypothetical protein
MKIFIFGGVKKLLLACDTNFVIAVVRPNKKIGVVPVTRPTHWGAPPTQKYFYPLKVFFFFL